MQIGADSKIYAIRYNSKRLSCISQPNDSGYNCQFIDTAVLLVKGFGFISLPHTIYAPSLTLKVKQNSCNNFTFSFTSLLEGATYKQWAFGDNSFSNDSIATHSYTLTADSVLLTFSIVPIGSIDTLKMSRWVMLQKRPLASFVYQTNGCRGDAVNFNGSSTPIGTAPINNFQWQLGNGSFINQQQTFNYQYADTGNYVVKFWVTDMLGCTSDTATQTIAVNKKVVGGFTLPSNLCNNFPLLLTNTSSQYNTSINSLKYFFSNGDSLVNNNPNPPPYFFTVAGSYNIKQIVTSNDGCKDSIIKNMVIWDTPLVDAGTDKAIQLGNQVVLNASVTGSGYSFLWQPATALNDTSLLQPTASPTKEITYLLTVTDSHGCQASDSVNVQILKTLTVPNAFSPNGDGINDTWDIPNLSAYNNVRVWVYNRAGQLVFSSYGYSTPWNGKRNGKSLSVGTYYYIIQSLGEIKPYTGSVTILK